MSENVEFESVKGGGPIWEPKQTGNKKQGNLTALQAGDDSWLIGYYLGPTIVKGPNGESVVHKFKMTSVGNEDHIQGEMEGDEIGIWGSKVLDDNLSKLTPGEYCKVVWEGLKKPKQGGNEYHGWDVQRAKGVEPIAVGAMANVTSYPTGVPAKSIEPSVSNVQAPEATQESPMPNLPPAESTSDDDPF